MTIDHERPEDELHTARASELLTVVALIATVTGGRPDVGAMVCPICRTGVLAYDTRGIGTHARCATPGCVVVL